MTVPSFVAEAAAEAVRMAAAEIGTPQAEALAAEAGTIVYDPPALAERLRAAIAELEDSPRLANLAEGGLTLPAVPETTASRRIQRANQSALVDFLRGLATVALARRSAIEAFPDRTSAFNAREEVGDLLDARESAASAGVFRSLRALRAAVVAHVARIARDLPQVTSATPAAVLPALVVAYDVYGDVARAGEIAARNRLPRPGFVPARPIEVLR